MNEGGPTAELTQQHEPHQASFYIFEVSASSSLSHCSTHLSCDLYRSRGFRAQLLEAIGGFYVGKVFDCLLGVLLGLGLDIIA